MPPRRAGLGDFRLQVLVGLRLAGNRQPVGRRRQRCKAFKQPLVFGVKLPGLIVRDHPDSADISAVDVEGTSNSSTSNG